MAKICTQEEVLLLLVFIVVYIVCLNDEVEV